MAVIAAFDRDDLGPNADSGTHVPPTDPSDEGLAHNAIVCKSHPASLDLYGRWWVLLRRGRACQEDDKRDRAEDNAHLTDYAWEHALSESRSRAALIQLTRYLPSDDRVLLANVKRSVRSGRICRFEQVD